MVVPARALAVGVTVVVAWLVVLTLAIRHPFPFGMVDLEVYLAGGQALLDGTPLYSSHPPGSQLPFTYPPFAGLVSVLLAWLGRTGAVAVVTAASLVSLVVIVRLSIRHAGSPRLAARRAAVPVAVVLALCLEPVWLTIGLGQVNLVLAALVLADVLGDSRRPWRGVLVGLAAAVKLTPLIFVGYLFVTRRVRAGVTALGTFAGSVTLGWLVLPDASRLYWLDLVDDAERVGGVAYVGNQSLFGALTRLVGDPDAARPAWYLLAAAVAGLGLLAAAAVAAAGRELLGVVLCGLTGVLVSPISWTHHWVWIVPAAIAGVAWLVEGPAARRVRWGAVFAVGMGLVWWGPMWLLPHGADREYGHRGAQLLVADAYVLPGVLVLLGAAMVAAVSVGAVDRDAHPEAEQDRAGRLLQPAAHLPPRE